MPDLLPPNSGETADTRFVIPPGSVIMAPQPRSEAIDGATARKIERDSIQGDLCWTGLKIFIGLLIGIPAGIGMGYLIWG